jgi:hypothetical protein
VRSEIRLRAGQDYFQVNFQADFSAIAGHKSFDFDELNIMRSARRRTHRRSLGEAFIMNQARTARQVRHQRVFGARLQSTAVWMKLAAKAVRLHPFVVATCMASPQLRKSVQILKAQRVGVNKI